MKDLFNVAMIEQAATHLYQASLRSTPIFSFDKFGFIQHASQDLQQLELKQRSQQIEAALVRYLPTDFEHALSIIDLALHPTQPNIDTDSLDPNMGLCRWIVMPISEYVGRQGAQSIKEQGSQSLLTIALASLRELTKRFTSEFGIRHLLLVAPADALSIMTPWVDDDCHHVRRLVSEGTRPLLPWAMQLPEFKINPEWMLPLLTRLRDDQSEYVRRSVANHLNDISKQFPDIVANIAIQWLQDPNRIRTVKHACRTLIKQGHADTLLALGYDPNVNVKVKLRPLVSVVEMGGTQVIDIELTNDSSKEVSVLIDYIVRHQKANGKLTPKVFKWKALQLGPHQSVSLTKKHVFKPISTRVYHAGEHGIDIQLNGTVRASQAFNLALRG